MSHHLASKKAFQVYTPWKRSISKTFRTVTLWIFEVSRVARDGSLSVVPDPVANEALKASGPALHSWCQLQGVRSSAKMKLGCTKLAVFPKGDPHHMAGCLMTHSWRFGSNPEGQNSISSTRFWLSLTPNISRNWLFQLELGLFSLMVGPGVNLEFMPIQSMDMHQWFSSLCKHRPSNSPNSSLKQLLITWCAFIHLSNPHAWVRGFSEWEAFSASTLLGARIRLNLDCWNFARY